tara:strand:- start:224 stop:583 length:360 start_codon:yes stop_codon:yes gene_type:complete
MKRFIIIVLFLFIFSCSQHRETNPPENLIGQELMGKIMLDIILMKNINRNGYAIKEKRNLLVDQYILQKYGVDSLQFNQSQNFYSKNPKEYTYIFEMVQFKLNELRDSLQKIEIDKMPN